MSFICDLGKPNDNHFDPAKLLKKTKPNKSKSNIKRERDNLRAKLYQQRLSQTKDSVPESAAAPAVTVETSAEATTEPGDNTEDEETSKDVTGDDTINLPTRVEALAQELNNIIETSDTTVAANVRDYLPLAEARTLTWAEPANKTAVTRETVCLKSEWMVAEGDDGSKTFKLWEHPCWNHSEMLKWCSDDCASPLQERLLDDQKQCDCGGITAEDVMSYDGWQYDHGYCSGSSCLRGEIKHMCWRARLTVMLDRMLDEEVS